MDVRKTRIRERYAEELEGGILVVDIPEEKGVELIIPLGEDATNARIFMYDDEAEQLVQVVQNKINARL